MKVVHGMLEIVIQQAAGCEEKGDSPQYHEIGYRAMVGEVGRLLTALADVEIIPKPSKAA